MGKGKKVALFLPSLAGGGAERVSLRLAKGFLTAGLEVDLFVANKGGVWEGEVPEGARVFYAGASRTLFSVPKFMSYLRSEKPSAVISVLAHANVIAALAKRFSGVDTRLILSEHVLPSQVMKYRRTLKEALTYLVAGIVYRSAAVIVAVSEAVREDVIKLMGVPESESKVTVIPNPVLDQEVWALAREEVWHPFFQERVPVIIGVGRLSLEKDFTTLIRAFALIRQSQVARLLILGEGPERRNLEQLVSSLGLDGDVDMPGFVKNPYAFMARADVFVLSSLYEALPTVLIEALALGVPIVATDCTSGPREILENGKWGYLAPIGDVQALAVGIQEALRTGKRRIPPEAWWRFTVDYVIQKYLEILRL